MARMAKVISDRVRWQGGRGSVGGDAGPVPCEQEKRLHLVHIFPTFALGGSQMRFASLAARFAGTYRHTVLALDGQTAAAETLAPEVACRLLPLERRYGLGDMRAMRRLLRDLKPDLLLTYNWGAVEWAFANRVRPICRHLHFEDGFGPEETPQHQLRRRVLFRRLALGGAHMQIVVPSQVLYRLATEVWKLPPARVRYVPNGIDVVRFAAPPALGLPGGLVKAPGEIWIGTVAALRPEKNLHRLLRAAAALPEEPHARVVVVGEGPERGPLEATAARLGLDGRVLFTGRLSAPERVLHALDLFVLSSDTEQMPYSLLEAMAAGLPAVATDVGDVADILAPANRPYVVPPAAEDAFAAALARLVAAPELRAALGRANRLRVRQEFSQERMFATYAALFGR